MDFYHLLFLDTNVGRLSLGAAVFVSVVLSWRALSTVRLGKRSAISKNQKRTDLSLGGLEKWYTTRHRAGQYNNFAICAQVSGSLPEGAELDFAVGRFLRCSPCLRWALDAKEEVFREVRAKPAIKITARVDGETWKRVVEQEHRVGFPPGGADDLLWRFHFVKTAGNQGDHEIIFVTHHVLGDGMSAVFLLRKFLESLHTDSTPQEAPALPVLEELVDVRPTVGYLFWRYLIQEKLSDLFPMIRKWTSPWLGDGENIPFEERDSDALYLQIEEVSLLQSACRKRMTTVHGAITSAAAAATLAAAGRPVMCSIQGAVNLRDFVGIPSDTAGCYISSAGVKYLASPTSSFWGRAISTKREIHAWKENSPQLLGLTSYIDGDWVAYHRKMAESFPSGRDKTLIVSNLGHHNFASVYLTESGRELKFARAWFSAANSKEGPLFVCNCISSNNTLTININYVRGSISPEQAQLFLKNFKNGLELAKSTNGKNFSFSHILAKN